jgi:hypothetical protein
VYDDEETLFEGIDNGVDLSHLLAPYQLRVRNDPSTFRALIGPRRCGKTRLMVVEMLELADQFPGCAVPYLALNYGRAKDIVMTEINKLTRLGQVKVDTNFSEHKIFTRNGGCILLGGLSTEPEAEKGRGGSSPGLYVDEAGAINKTLLKRTIVETYGPATRDFEGLGGRGIMVCGTPDYVPGSYWEQLCGGNTHVSKFGASVHHMTLFENPFYLGRAQKVIDNYCRQNGLKPTDSKVQREWYGRFCIDSDGLAYPHWTGLVHPMHLMPLHGYTTLGIDLGSDHPCAWVVIRWVLVETVDRAANKVRYIHHGHVLESYEESDLNIHDVAAITREFQRIYSVGTTHGDSGGGGKMTIDSLASVMGVDIAPVVKSGQKQDRIWMLDSMLANQTLHVHDRAQTLAEQFASVPKERQSNGLYDHMAGYGDHSLDACHYAILAARQHPLELDLGKPLTRR